MVVKKGKRYVKISSPLSILAIGLVFISGGISLLFMGNFFSEEIMNEEFRKVSYFGGFYMLSIGVPSILVFINSVLSPPKDVDDITPYTIDNFIIFITLFSLTIGLTSVGIYLVKYKPDFYNSGMILSILGGTFTLFFIPVLLFFKSGGK